MNKATATQLRFYDLEPEADTLDEDVLQGLRQAQKFIPPKYFYDEFGSRLFDAICETREYYPTRTEMAILEENLEAICTCLGHDCVLVEPGSGSSRKVRLLLDKLEPHTYMPLDISSDYLKSVAHGLAEDFPHINVTAACVDYTAPITLPHYPENRRRVAFFPGSSIGNFEPEEAVTFLGNLADLVKPNGGLLIGVDLKKEASILNAAYNDKQGITARFNLNLLTHINRALGADFDLDRFEHRAFYNDRKGRVEMHLVSKCAQQVTVAGHCFQFTTGEPIHTENSYKYTVEEFQALAEEAG
ncbi:MAG: L-histidine N(alpha)-methyltransferase, partial [Anaerolineae bacterium]